jgi:hypothetical protein
MQAVTFIYDSQSKAAQVATNPAREQKNPPGLYLIWRAQKAGQQPWIKVLLLCSFSEKEKEQLNKVQVYNKSKKIVFLDEMFEK